MALHCQHNACQNLHGTLLLGHANKARVTRGVGLRLWEILWMTLVSLKRGVREWQPDKWRNFRRKFMTENGRFWTTKFGKCKHKSNAEDAETKATPHLLVSSCVHNYFLVLEITHKQTKLLVVLLTVWQMSACVVPIDSKLPCQKYMIQHSGAHILYCAVDLPIFCSNYLVFSSLCFSDSSTSVVHSLSSKYNESAAVIFTSGSTGMR